MSSFSGKAVLVSGSSSGMGEIIALTFAARGASVAVCGRDEERVQAVAESCRKSAQEAGLGGKVIALAGDMTSAEDRANTVKKTVEAFGRLDVLVANHGGLVTAPDLATLSEDSYDLQMNSNVKSRLFLIKEAAPYLEKTKGNIVSNNSILSTLASVGNIGYQMSMAALDHMVRCLALELGPKGIRVNAFNPTIVDGTRLMRGVNTWDSSMVDYCLTSHPLHGRCASRDEVASVALFLASEEARFISGECVKVDGAVSAKGWPRNFYSSSADSKSNK